MSTMNDGTGSLAGSRFMKRVIVGCAILAGLIAATLLLQSCGGEGGDHSSSQTEPASPPVSEAVVASTEPALVTQTTSQLSATAEGGGLPPEIALQPIDVHVLPGQAVTISVQATPDVTELMLSDGLNDPQPMMRDASGDNTWSVDYRVPLRPREDRFGLSVTAKNEHRRWRRLWVFLEVQKPAGFVKAEVDSAAKP